ncbi:molecular chaperone TorD family protein [candidate division KSB1 bacterium]|nr:molecular chaperone TorD family protein [candidate division KSB1 bacterium]
MHELDLALCRSAMYEALALGFNPPTHTTVVRLLHEDENAALSEIAAIVDAHTQDDRLGNLAPQVQRLWQRFGPQDLETLADSYLYLFGHTAQAQVPLHETEYGEDTMFQQPQQLGDIAGFFNAFGLKLNVERHERADHLSCECEFMAFLTRKEAYALQQNDLDMLEATRRGQRLFLRDHLGRYIPAFANLLRREASHSFYGALGNLCHDFVRGECLRFQVQMGPEQLRLRPEAQNDACFTCGAGDEVIQLLRPSANAVES